MSRYERARTNGSYGGLSAYHGLGGRGEGHRGEGKGKGESKEGRRKGRKAGGGEDSLFVSLLRPSQGRSRELEQRSILTAQRAERVEQRGERALTAGRDDAAQSLMAQAERLQERSGRQESKAQQLRLPYTDVPLLPKAIAKQADADLMDTPLSIADQTAPIPAAIPTTAPATIPAKIPVTLPLMPPPLLLAPGRPQMLGPQMFGPPILGPGGPGPQPRMFMGGRVSPANAAAAAAAVAASYFLFF